MDFPSPFSVDQPLAYKEWRANKLNNYPQSLEEVLVPIGCPESPSALESSTLSKILNKTNFVLFEATQPGEFSKRSVVLLGKHLGLHHLDGNLCSDKDNISSITVDTSPDQAGYIPYTNRPIGWHTDGYYNEIPEKTIHGFILYCVNSATEGGENRVLDHELAYIYLRDLEPRFITALNHPNAMTIPPNVVKGIELRGEQTGPVFSTLGPLSQLHMRYTIRQRNVEWRNDALIHEATAALNEFLNGDHPGIFRFCLKPGQGIIANNVLHMRTGFDDLPNTPQRLLYRARYFDRTTTT